MEQGAEYAEVLAKAQRAGYAEADPSADVDGYDARAKLCVLARLALGAELVPEEVPAQTISLVSAIDFAYAKEMDCTIRQVSRAERVASQAGGAPSLGGDGAEGGIRARVGPMLVPRESPIAWSRGTQNMVVTSGRFGGDVVFSGHGAGGHPTAVAVMSDVLAVAGESRQLQPAAAKVALSGDVLAPHYLRFIVADEPGIVAAIAGELAKERINIDLILQHRGHASERLPFVVTTEPCLRSTLDRAITAIAAMSFMVEAPLVMQILALDDAAND